MNHRKLGDKYKAALETHVFTFGQKGLRVIAENNANPKLVYLIQQNTVMLIALAPLPQTLTVLATGWVMAYGLSALNRVTTCNFKLPYPKEGLIFLQRSKQAKRA